ncbi:MAG TPA: xanthine dehydrogenase family protein molybdopterin-binding subunit, partial [Rhodopila sp.]
MTERAVIGDAPLRREDARFVTGHGTYLDDIAFDGVTHAVFLRSPHAHARIVSIDMTEALKVPGIVAILTAKEAAADGLGTLRPVNETNLQTNEPFRFMPQPVIAADVVRYAGEPVALIIAESRYAALDAAEQVIIDFDTLSAVIRTEDAVKPGAPLVADDVPGNLCMDWHWGQIDAVEDAIGAAPHVVTVEANNHRIITNPMEPRGAVGIYDGR